MSKLWELKPIRSGEPSTKKGAWNPWYDKAFGFVVRADSEQQARELADSQAGDENDAGKGRPWLDEKQSSCKVLTHKGPAGVILRDFASA